MRVYCLLLFEHPTTDAERQNINDCEKWVLAKLKAQFPAPWHWPGLLEQSRLYPSRSEWVRGVNERIISKTFRDARESGLFGPCLFVYDDEMDDVPAQWYRFRRGLIDKKKEDLAKTAPDRKRKREEMENFSLADTNFKTTAADRAMK